jgi:hypothetical protein
VVNMQALWPLRDVSLACAAGSDLSTAICICLVSCSCTGNGAHQALGRLQLGSCQRR